jgi:hypothetical protein
MILMVANINRWNGKETKPKMIAVSLGYLPSKNLYFLVSSEVNFGIRKYGLTK